MAWQPPAGEGSDELPVFSFLGVLFAQRFR